MQKIIIGESHHSGKIVEIEEIGEEASKVRIIKGHEGAGQVIWLNNSEIDWNYGEEKPEETIVVDKFQKLKKIAGIVSFILIFILVGIGIYLSPTKEEKRKSEVQIATIELNNLNSEDAIDIDIRNEAQARVDERSKKKSALIRIINYKGQ